MDILKYYINYDKRCSFFYFRSNLSVCKGVLFQVSFIIINKMQITCRKSYRKLNHWYIYNFVQTAFLKEVKITFSQCHLYLRQFERRFY